MADAPGRPSLAYRRTRPGFLTWLAAKAVYYRKFHDKWMAQRVQNGVYLDYAELSKRPDEMMRDIITRAGATVDEARLVKAVEESGGVVGGMRRKGVAYTPRVNSDSPYYD